MTADKDILTWLRRKYPKKLFVLAVNKARRPAGCASSIALTPIQQGWKDERADLPPSLSTSTQFECLRPLCSASLLPKVRRWRLPSGRLAQSRSASAQSPPLVSESSWTSAPGWPLSVTRSVVHRLDGIRLSTPVSISQRTPPLSFIPLLSSPFLVVQACRKPARAGGR